MGFSERTDIILIEVNRGVPYNRDSDTDWQMPAGGGGGGQRRVKSREQTWLTEGQCESAHRRPSK